MKEDRVAKVISKIIASAMGAIGDKPLKAIIEGERTKYVIVWKGSEVEITLSGQHQ